MPTMPLKNRAGRPKGSKKHDPSNVIDKIMPDKERIEKLAELARGVEVQETKEGKDGRPIRKIYSLPPSEKAIAQLNAYKWGKPVERSEMEIKSDGKPIPVALIPPIVRPEEDEKGKKD